MMTSKKEQKAQAKSNEDLNQKLVDKHNAEYAALHPEKRDLEHQHVTCTRCGFELYSDEDSEFDGKSGRMHHVSRCLELALASLSRMKQAGAKDPDADAPMTDEEKEKKAEESKKKSIEENMAGRSEIVAGRNREQWEIDLEAKGGEAKVEKDREAAAKKAAEKKTAEQKVEAQKKENLSQDQRAAEVSGEKEHQDSQIEKAK